jgi:hypothetical protein
MSWKYSLPSMTPHALELVLFPQRRVRGVKRTHECYSRAGTFNFFIS